MKATETFGLDGLGADLIRETRKIARPLVGKAGNILRKRIKDKLKKRGGPSRPGDPPAREEGALLSVIGRDRPRRLGDTFSVEVGVGAGKSAIARAEKWKGDGINVYEYAWLQEHGGIGADGRLFPARSYVRAAAEEVEAQIEQLFIAALR